MRTHVFTVASLLAALLAVGGAISAGGMSAVVAAVGALVAYAQMQVLWRAVVDSLNPRTDAEAKYLRRVGRDILERHRQREVQEPAAAKGGA